MNEETLKKLNQPTEESARMVLEEAYKLRQGLASFDMKTERESVLGPSTGREKDLDYETNKTIHWLCLRLAEIRLRLEEKLKG